MTKGLRKFLLCVYCITGGFICFASSTKFTGDNLVYLLIGIATAYVTGNTIAKFSKGN